MAFVTHLRKSGSGMLSRTACGRNILRTPIAANWADFKVRSNQCEKCAASKLALFMARADAKRV